MKKRGKLGGQNKVPRIITKREMLSELIEFVRDPREAPVQPEAAQGSDCGPA